MLGRNKSPIENDGTHQTNQELKSSRRVTFRKVGAIATAAVVVAGAFSVPTNIIRANKLNNYEEVEKLRLDAVKQNGSQCLNKMLLLGAGVKYRKTPQSIDSEFPLKVLDNEMYTVPAGKVEKVKKPSWYTDASNNTWAIFNSKEISDDNATNKLAYVNVGKIIDQDSNTDTPQIGYLELNNASEDFTASCELTSNNTFVTKNDLPAAYTIEEDIASIQVGFDAKK